MRLVAAFFFFLLNFVGQSLSYAILRSNNDFTVNVAPTPVLRNTSATITWSCPSCKPEQSFFLCSQQLDPGGNQVTSDNNCLKNIVCEGVGCIGSFSTGFFVAVPHRFVVRAQNDTSPTIFGLSDVFDVVNASTIGSPQSQTTSGSDNSSPTSDPNDDNTPSTNTDPQPTSSNTVPSSQAQLETSQSEKTNRTAIIAGSVVGGVIGIIAIAIALFLIFRCGLFRHDEVIFIESKLMPPSPPPQDVPAPFELPAQFEAPYPRRNSGNSWVSSETQTKTLYERPFVPLTIRQMEVVRHVQNLQARLILLCSRGAEGDAEEAQKIRERIVQLQELKDSEWALEAVPEVTEPPSHPARF